MKNVFIVGGAGFVGSAIVRRLLGDLHVQQIRVYDNLSSGRIDHLHGLEFVRLSVQHADVHDKLTLTVGMAGYDTVIHLASNPDIAKAAADPTVDFREGTELTQNVLEACRVNGVERLIYASGSGVYGEDPLMAFREDHGPLMPTSPYGASKLAGEAMISAYCRMFGLSSLAFRFANLVGPRQTHGVGFDFMHRLASGQSQLDIMGDGTQLKSYLHIDDALNAVFTAPFKAGHLEAYNVASDDRISVTDIAHLVVQVLGLEPCSVQFRYTGGDRGWKGDVPQIRLSTSKIKSLGWLPKRTSSQAMISALNSMLP